MADREHEIYLPPIAEDVEFDPTNCDDITSDNTQGAIDELCAAAQLAASPGYAFGRSGTHSAGTWLIGTETESNKRGLPFGLEEGFIKKITISTQNTPGAFTVEIWEHTGDLTGATLVGSVTTASTASTEDFLVNWSVSKDIQLAAKISTTSGQKPKETGVFLVIKGTLT